ncbi:hypothetical protein ACHAWF_001310 [Thalassiosira exigua]
MTNVDLGNNKGKILKALSAFMANSTGKQKSYVAMCITDNSLMVFPPALGCIYSLGAINMTSNGKIQKCI